MITDLFNNPSNDYADPKLNPCPNDSNKYSFEFLTSKEAGIINGSNVVQTMDLSKIKIPVSGWVEEKKLIQPGEVMYVPGLTKGLLNRTQEFNIPSTAYAGTNSEYFLSIDLSINYYNNFKYYNKNIHANPNIDSNINIADVLNNILKDNNIKITTSWDPSTLKFVSKQEGYDYDISNISLEINGSNDVRSPFVLSEYPLFDLNENLEASLPASKYPNGASKGYILTTSFPSIAATEDKWIYMNKVNSPISMYKNHNITINTDIVTYYDPSTIISEKPIITNIDVSGNISSATFNGNIIGDAIAINSIISDCSIVNSVITDSSIMSNSFGDNNTINGILSKDRSLLNNSVIWDSSLSYLNILDTSIYSSNIVDSSISNCTLYNTTLNNSYGSNNKIIEVDASTSLNGVDSSAYYTNDYVKIDVGMSGSGTSKILSAAEYLNYINSNNLWEKIGSLSAQISTLDLEGSIIKNLVGGFYVFNPHTWPVYVEYMLIN